MKIVEIFKSIQGESTYAGLPCTFIRLSGCNLRCTWCDTTYSFLEGSDLTVSKIISQVETLGCNLVEITGGEPLVQSKELLELIEVLLSKKYKILLETNGSLTLKDFPSSVCKIMDIKLPSSGMFEHFLYDNLNYLIQTDEIKFVVNDWLDYETMSKLIREHNLALKCSLLLSKTSSSAMSHRELADRMLEDNLPVRYQLQFHKIIWQDERGK